MKIKGKLLLKEGLLETKIDELVYITQNSITIYNNELYLNVSDVFFRESTASFVIPIKRVGYGEEDFEIDMRNLPLIHLNSLDKPQKKDGWIGPFSFDFEYYTKEKFWERYNSSELLNLMYQSKLHQKDDDVRVMSKIRRRKFDVEIESLDKELLEKEKGLSEEYLSNISSVLEQMKESDDYIEADLVPQRLLITETKKDINILNNILERKKEELFGAWFDSLTLDGHRKALALMDLDGPNADYELAEKHKKKISELEANI